MAGRPSARLIQAMARLLDSDGAMTPYACARQAGIALNTIYRAPLYKQYKTACAEPDLAKRAALLAALRRTLEVR